MQGNQLPPRRQHVLRRSLAAGAPDRRGGDSFLDAGCKVSKPAPIKFGRDGLAVRRLAMGKDIDQLPLDPRRIGVAELEFRKLLQMLVQQPGMIDHGPQDERLAARNGGTVAAVHRARRKLRARNDVGLA